MISVASPVAGWVTSLSDVADPVFADRMLGDGIAVDPVEGRILAPSAGTISSIHAAGHAVTLALDSGPVLLIHVGLDTVALGGAGFSPAVAEGQRVGQGDLLIEFDLDLVARRARSLVTPVIVTNGDAFSLGATHDEGPITAGEQLFECEPKGGAAAPMESAEPTVSRSLTLLLAHGVHARPAARLAKAVAGFDASAEIVAEDGRAASARSPVAILGLGLCHGAAITVRAGGPQAEAAVEVLVDMLETGMGESAPPAKSEPPVISLDASGRLNGIAAVSGLAIGPAWRLQRRKLDVAERAEEPAEKEWTRLAAARERVQSQLGQEAAGTGPGAAIAAAHLAMIDDPLLEEMAQQLIETGSSAAWAWRQAVRELGAPLKTATDARFTARLDDLEDLERRVLVELLGDIADESTPPEGAIVIADTLYPSHLNPLSQSRIAGIATASGGATSHAAIIAASLGIPMIVGLGPALFAVEDGAMLVLEGNGLTLASEEQIAQARDRAVVRARRLEAARGRAHEQTTTTDGTRIEVFANLGSVADAEVAVEEGAEGCGLLRTEFLFLDRDLPPDEDEQRTAYQQIADTLGDRPLIVRTLDIGADKPAPWLPIAAEDNPALGLRGIRLQLARPDLLETQFRALLGVQSPGPLRIMLPMVGSVAEIREASTVLSRLAADMNVDAPELGIMVETPAAALISAALAAEAAFFSIGTNDLSQYALARDRTNPAVASGLDGLDPAVLRLIDETVRGANVRGRVTGVCGGLAAVPEAVPILLGLGLTELSVPAASIAEIKAVVRSLDLAQCREIAAAALNAPDAAAVRALANPILEQSS